jgi:serine/threonine protein kinase
VTSVPIRIDSGTCVGPYVVDRRLALGKTSSLYLVHDSDGRRLVLKTVVPDAVTGAARARFLRETRALAAVDHPAVVRVHGVGDHEGTPWVAMDYVQGTDLKRVLAERRTLAVALALGYAIDAAEGLVAAHDAGVVHRDIKPSNLILTPEGRIVLVDFGIARRRIDAPSADVPSATLAYLSPEQIEHGLADERSDVWGMGCVLHEMVVGVPPFGDGDQVSVAAILRDEPRLGPHLSGAIVHVVSACLRKSSFARVASPRELLVVLRDALEDPTSELAAGSERPPSSFALRPAQALPRARAHRPRAPGRRRGPPPHSAHRKGRSCACRSLWPPYLLRARCASR